MYKIIAGLKKFSRVLVIISFSSALTTTSTSYAMDDDFGDSTNSSALIYAATGIGAGVGLYFLIKSFINDQTSSVGPGSPVILSSSNHNLLYISDAPSAPTPSERNLRKVSSPIIIGSGKTAVGKLIVKNSSKETAKEFKIVGDASPITVTSSTCSNVPSGGTCEFTLSYNGAGRDLSNVNQLNSANIYYEPKKVKVVGGNGDSDADVININILTTFANVLYPPSIVATKANGLFSSSPGDFVTLAKNGVDFLYAANDSGVFKSSDGGATWIPLLPLRLPPQPKLKKIYKIIANIHLCTNGQDLYVNTTDGEIKKSSDGGVTWQSVVNNQNSPFVDYAIQTLCWFNGMLYIGTYEGGVYQYDVVNLSLVDRQLSSVSIYSLYVFNGKLYAGGRDSDQSSKEVVWKYENSSWTPIGTGFLNVTIIKDLYAFNGVLYAASDSGVWQLQNDQWVQLGSVSSDCNSPNPGDICGAMNSLAFFNGTLYAVGDYGVWQYNGSESSWAKVFSNGGTALFTLNNILFVGSGLGVWLTNDGTNWQPANNGVRSIQALYCDNSNYLYAGFGDRMNGVFRSSDGGANWQLVGVGQLTAVTSFAVNGDTVYAAGTKNIDGADNIIVWQTTDHGNTWTQVSGTLSGGIVTSLVVGGDGKLYAAVDVSRVYQYDGTTNWHDVSINDQTGANCLAVGNNTLYAGTQNCGIWQTTLGQSVSWSQLMGQNSDLNSATITAITGNSNLLYAANVGFMLRKRQDPYYGVWQYLNSDWQQLNPVFIFNQQVNVLALANNYLYAGADSVYRIPVNIESGTFSMLDQNFSWNVSALCFSSDNSSIYAGSGGGVYKALLAN